MCSGVRKNHAKWATTREQSQERPICEGSPSLPEQVLLWTAPRLWNCQATCIISLLLWLMHLLPTPDILLWCGSRSPDQPGGCNCQRHPPTDNQHRGCNCHPSAQSAYYCRRWVLLCELQWRHWTVGRQPLSFKQLCTKLFCFFRNKLPKLIVHPLPTFWEISVMVLASLFFICLWLPCFTWQ